MSLLDTAIQGIVSCVYFLNGRMYFSSKAATLLLTCSLIWSELRFARTDGSISRSARLTTVSYLVNITMTGTIRKHGQLRAQIKKYNGTFSQLPAHFQFEDVFNAGLEEATTRNRGRHT